MKTPLWQPTTRSISQSNMMHFMQHMNALYHLNLQTYPQLYDWSINQPELFWSAVWQFCGIKSSKKWEQVLIKSNKMPEAQWFTGAQLNFAENLLSRRDDHLAIIFANENGLRRTFTYQELYEQVIALANALRAMGIIAGDRVAGYLPNMPETVIAMLATTAIGAVWSSCSPDFGVAAVVDRFTQIAPKVLFTVDGHYYHGKKHEDLQKIAEISLQLPSLEKIVVIPYVNPKPDITALSSAILLPDFLKDVSATDEYAFTQLPFAHPIYILYSSGTTGIPKCIVHGAGGTLIQHLKELTLHTNLTKDDVIFYYTSCGWMMWNWLISSLAVGATLVLYDGSPTYPNPNALFDLIDAEKINIFGVSAKYLTAVEKAGVHPIKTNHLTSLKTILSTGSPLLAENYSYVYEKIKQDVCLSSISGGTDIVSCFALGNPILPVYSEELQCIGLGMKVEVFDEKGKAVQQQKGELVCTAPFPSMPIYFWNDPVGQKYQDAYFTKFPNVWAHGDYAEITENGGVIIYGRSDALLKPGGIRIGTAEIYRQVEKLPDILESIAVGQDWQNDVRIILFVKLRAGVDLTTELQDKIKATIRNNASPHHVPAKIIQVMDIPRTVSGKIVELAVRETIHNRPVKNIDAIANPEALEYFKNLPQLS
jgi:acetoacetyl-CoA synthetase